MGKLKEELSVDFGRFLYYNDFGKNNRKSSSGLGEIPYRRYSPRAVAGRSSRNSDVSDRVHESVRFRYRQLKSG